jgi:hypothetical protein
MTPPFVPPDLVRLARIESPIDMTVPTLPPILTLDDLAMLLQASRDVTRATVEAGIIPELPFSSRLTRRISTVTMLRYFQNCEDERLSRVAARVADQASSSSET